MTDAYPSGPTRNVSSTNATIAGSVEALQRGPRRFWRAGEALEPLTSDRLDARGLDPELCDRLGLVTAVASDGTDPGEWVAIPYRVNGQRTHWKYRRVQKVKGQDNFSQDKGARQYFWNYDVITDATLLSDDLLVCEGEFDAIAAIQAGIERVVSVPNGAPDKALRDGDGPKFQYALEALKDINANIKKVVLATDADAQGTLLMSELAMRLGRPRCKYVAYPEGSSDLNGVLHLYGPAAVRELALNAPWVRVDGLHRMSELPPAPAPQPHPITIPLLRDHMFLRRGDFSVITGIPGHGKTTLINDIACGMAGTQGWRTAFASFEQHPQHDHRRALRTWYHRVPEVRQNATQRKEADAWIDEWFGFIVPSEDEDCNLDWILDMMATAAIRMECKLCVIDPWNELDHARSPGQSLTEYTGEAIRQMKRFARKFNVHLMVAAHPTKMAKDKDGKVPMPSLYDVSDSAAWFNKADLGLIVHQEDGLTKLRVSKARYESIGSVGTDVLKFDKDSMRFVEPMANGN